MKKTPFLAVEGVIGVGKTSLASRIAEKYSFALLKEIVEENPFLGKFYDNIDEWSFQTEMFFLCNRYKQLNDIKVDYLDKNVPVVADYHIFKNTIFSEMTLKENEFNKYINIYDILVSDMPKPNLIIYLDASLDTILRRISLRGREIEKNIDPNYLQTLSEGYAKFMESFQEAYPKVPVLKIDGDKLDFVSNQEDMEYIFNEVDRYLNK